MRNLIGLLVGLGFLLVACATTRPYWEDRKWTAHLYQAIQASIELPPNAVTTGVHTRATVQFTYSEGKLNDIQILKSSGSDLVDVAFVKEIGGAHVPVAVGAQADVPHRFQLDVQAPTPFYGWADPWWQEDLLSEVQSVLHQPDAAGPPIEGIHAKVRFTVADGVIEHPEIVTSTGYVDMDRLMLQQIVLATPPKSAGPHAEEPHEFELLLEMPTPFESFQYRVYRAIDYQKVYPKHPVIMGIVGSTTVDFDYQDAKANNIVVTKSSGDKDLDEASINAVTNAILPVAPNAYTGKLLHMEVVVCYSLGLSPPSGIKDECPTGKNVVTVRGVRIRRSY